MDKQEFEKKLGQIKIFNEVPESVDKKLEKAYKKIDEVKKSNTPKLTRITGIAASFVIAVFLIGNGIAYARKEDNIYSWILSKIGIQQEYEEIKVEVNQTAEDNGIKITLVDLGYDKNHLVLGYKIESAENQFYNNEEIIEFINEEISIYENNEDIVSQYPNKVRSLNKRISENELVIYEVFDINDIELKNKEIEINILSIDGYYIDETGVSSDWRKIKEGNWKFKLENIELKDIQFDNYIITPKREEKEITINSLNITTSKLFSTIYINMDIKSDMMNLGMYFIEILDSKNNLIMSSGTGIGESREDVLEITALEKLNKNEEYTVNVLKETYDTNTDTQSVELIDQFNIKLDDKTKVQEQFKIDIELPLSKNCKCNSIIIENTQEITNIILESNIDVYYTEATEDDTYYYLVRIVDEKGVAVGEINQYGSGEKNYIITDLLNKDKKYTLEMYKYKHIEFDGEYIVWDIDKYNSEEDLQLIDEIKFKIN